MVSQYIENLQFVEQKIIESILETQNLDLDVDYLSVYIRKMNATGTVLEEDKAVVVDELLTYTVLSFFLTVFSLAYDSGRENFTRCIKNCIVLLDLQGKKHKIGVHSLKDRISRIFMLKTPAEFFIMCIWIPPHKGGKRCQNAGNYRN